MGEKGRPNNKWNGHHYVRNLLMYIVHYSLWSFLSSHQEVLSKCQLPQSHFCECRTMYLWPGTKTASLSYQACSGPEESTFCLVLCACVRRLLHTALYISIHRLLCGIQSYYWFRWLSNLDTIQFILHEWVTPIKWQWSVSQSWFFKLHPGPRPTGWHFFTLNHWSCTWTKYPSRWKRFS